MFKTLDKEIILKLQENIPLSSTPYKDMADELNLNEDEFINRLQSYIKYGILKRIGAIIYHRKAGFKANALVVWKINTKDLDRIGEYLISIPEISHCYERKACASWNYNLYTMIHEKDRESCNNIIANIATAISCTNYKILYSTKELKKTSMKYFS